MSSFAEMIENITPEIYQSLKLAVEIGKWPDGRKLTQEQKELSLQAMIAWEILQPAWERHPAAGAWLAGECGESQTGPKPGDFRIVP